MAFIKVPIEVDITYVNHSWFSFKNKKNKEKHYVIGFMERGGKAIIKAIPNNNPETIIEAVKTSIEKGVTIYCEENILPDSLRTEYDIHELKGQHVNGDIHLSNVKNLWKDLKRVIKRTHIQVSQKYLQMYCNEVAWRVNHRDLSSSQKFDALLSLCATTPFNKKNTPKKIIE